MKGQMPHDQPQSLFAELGHRHGPHVVLDADGSLLHVGLSAFQSLGRSPADSSDLIELLLGRIGATPGSETVRAQRDGALAALDAQEDSIALGFGFRQLQIDVAPLGGGRRLLSWQDDPETDDMDEEAGLLAEVAELMDEGFVLYDLDEDGEEVVRLFNERAATALELPAGVLRRGAKRKDIIQHCFDRGDHDSTAEQRQYLKRIAAGDEVQALAQRPSGRYVQSISRQRRTSGGGSIVLLVDVSHGVSDVAQLKDAEERYRLLAETAPTGIIMLNAAGRVTFANEAALDLLDRSFEEVDLFSQLIPSDRQPLAAHLDSSGRFDAEIPVVYGTRHVMVAIAVSKRHKGAKVMTFADFTALRDARLRIEHLARHDPLTGLGNRAFFNLRWQAIEASDTAAYPAHLISFDLDRFKVVNDEHGHQVGDLLLQAVARRVASLCSYEDIFRLGGDEFAVILCGPSRSSALELAEKIVESLSVPFDLCNLSLSIGCSAGVASLPLDGANSDEVQNAADIALYEVKRNGRNGVACFDPTLRHEISERRRLESDLALAIARDELTLLYQPLFNLQNERIVGTEALLRWHNRRLDKAVPPDVFLPIAETSSLITLIDLWVARTAAAQIRKFIEAGIERPFMAINLSPLTLSSPEIVDRLAETLQQNGVDPALLEIEITTGFGIQDRERVFQTLSAFRAAGMKIAIDDFGVGYASLTYIRSLPIDRVKIDPSIIAGVGEDESTHAIVSAMLGLCHRLGLEVTAKGIESEAQWGELRQMGRLDGQGSHLAPPETAAVVVARLEAERRLTQAQDRLRRLPVNEARAG